MTQKDKYEMYLTMAWRLQERLYQKDIFFEIPNLLLRCKEEANLEIKTYCLKGYVLEAIGKKNESPKIN